MKIAIISEGWDPVFGGGQVHVEYLCKYLVQDFGSSVDLFTRKIRDTDGKDYSDNEAHLDGKWNIYRVGPIGLFFDKCIRIIHIFYFTGRFLKKAYHEKYDIIHAHSLLPGLPAKIVGSILRIPVVYTVHGSMHLDIGKKNYHFYAEKFLVTQLQYNQEIAVSHITLTYKNKNKNVLVVHNGVDMKAFDNVQNEIKYDGFSLLTVGRIDRQKNHICVINALNTFDKDYLDSIGFIRRIVGDGVLYEQCKKLVSDFGLNKYVVFLGVLRGDELIREYKRNHVFVLPSVAEGQPLTVLEAFAAGLPVIATDVGDNSYIIKNNHNGFLINPTCEDVAAMLKYVISLSEQERNILGKNGYDLVKSQYDWHTVISKIYGIYQNIIQR